MNITAKEFNTEKEGTKKANVTVTEGCLSAKFELVKTEKGVYLNNPYRKVEAAMGKDLGDGRKSDGKIAQAWINGKENIQQVKDEALAQLGW